MMCRHLFFMRHGFNTRIYSFVLMSNHFHLLMSTPAANVSEAMCYFMKESSRELTSLGNRINQTYGGRYHWCIIQKEMHLEHVYKYIYRNPVVSGLCEKVEDYPYSTLGGLLGIKPLWIPVEEDIKLFGNVRATLDWLNTPSPAENWKTVGVAMSRSRFWLPMAKPGKPHGLEELPL